MSLTAPYIITPRTPEQVTDEIVIPAIRAMKPGDTVTLTRHDPATQPHGHVWTAQVPMPRHLNPSRVLKEDTPVPTPPTVVHREDGSTEIRIKPDRPFGNYTIYLEPDEREQLVAELTDLPYRIPGGFSAGDIVTPSASDGAAYVVVTQYQHERTEGFWRANRNEVPLRKVNIPRDKPGGHTCDFRNLKKVGHVTADVR